MIHDIRPFAIARFLLNKQSYLLLFNLKEFALMKFAILAESVDITKGLGLSCSQAAGYISVYVEACKMVVLEKTKACRTRHSSRWNFLLLLQYRGTWFCKGGA